MAESTCKSILVDDKVVGELFATFANGDFARLVLFGAANGPRLAWHVLYRANSRAMYDAVVDATSGAILYRQNLTKLDYSISLAAALGYLMIRQQDPVGLITFDERIRQSLPARSRRTQLANILAVLARSRPGGPTEIGVNLRRTAAMIRHRSLVMLFSDLLAEPQNALKRVAEWLGLRTDATAVEQMMHPERSPFARFGPPGARLGNDIHFLERPALQSGQARPHSLEGPLGWRSDRAGFLPEVVELSRYLGYQ